MPTYRSDQHAVHVTVTGVPLDNQVWEKFDGGDLTTDDEQHLPGGMAPQVNLGGIPKRSDITLERAWSDTLIGAFKALDAATGRASCSIPVTTLDANGRPTGETITYSGVVKGVSRPGYDSTSSTTSKLQVVVGANRSIS